MKILFLTATYYPSSNGVAVSVKTTMETLLRKGHEVTVLAPENPEYKDDCDNIIRYSSLPNPLNKDYPIPILPLNSKIVNLLLNSRYDVVHAHHPFHIAWFAEQFAKKHDSALVFTYHTKYEYYADIYFRFIPKKYRTIILNLGTDSICKKADLVIVPSKSLITKLKNQHPYTSIEAIPTGVNFLETFATGENYLRNTLHIGVNSTILLSLSRLAEEKNIELTLNALALLPFKYHLVIAGSGPYENKLKKLALDLNVQDRVTFLGGIKHEDVSKIMNSAEIFLFPSVTETQGLNLLEAMYSGLPIVAVRSEISEEWVPNEVGVLSNNHPNEFANAIIKISKDCNDEKKRCIKKWASTFTLDNTTNILLNKYQEAIDKKRLTSSLNETGWQSWSLNSTNFFKVPTRNYPPQKDTYLCPFPTKAPSLDKRVLGWCSWYAFSNKINENVILKQAEFISRNKKRLPIRYLIVDDGWTKWGDWCEADPIKFPKGLSYLSATIKDNGLKPGIWMAPFLVERNSNLFKSQKNWLVNNMGVLTEGFKVSPFVDSFWKYRRFILDITNPEVQSYLFDSISKLIERHSFELLKLDFLYAPYFDPKLSTREAGYHIHKFIENIKTKYPSVHINGCGMPLATGVGVVDSMRIGPDTIAPYLDGLPFIGKFVNSIKVRLAINTMNKRQWTSSLWINDPDVFVCRKSLGIPEKLILELQKTISTTKGNIILGDDLTNISDHEFEKFIYPLFSQSP